MIARYTRPLMKKIWSEQNKYEKWLAIELLALEAYAKLKPEITESEVAQVRHNARIDIACIRAIETEIKHDVVAFTRAIGETLGPEKKWLHYGLTSTDIVDTAQSLRLKEANAIISSGLSRLQKIIKKLAKQHKTTYQIGRTHGIHAEVTTFGYKLALWYDEMNRNIERFNAASRAIEVAKIAGAVGNYAFVPLQVQDYVAQKLGLISAKIATQTLQRDRHAHYVFVLALIASSLDKFATEIRHLQRTEVLEVAEGFSSKQKGSSAMPHKRNPITCERISGLARVLRGFVVTANENIALWHERDISHSSAERILLADATTLVDYLLAQFIFVLENLYINKAQMHDNIALTKGVVFSQRAMHFLIEKNNWSRERAYDLVQEIAQQALTSKVDFGGLLIKKNVISSEERDQIYDLSHYAKNIDKVFKRLGL